MEVLGATQQKVLPTQLACLLTSTSVGHLRLRGPNMEYQPIGFLPIHHIMDTPISASGTCHTSPLRARTIGRAGTMKQPLAVSPTLAQRAFVALRIPTAIQILPVHRTRLVKKHLTPEQTPLRVVSLVSACASLSPRSSLDSACSVHECSIYEFEVLPRVTSCTIPNHPAFIYDATSRCLLRREYSFWSQVSV